MFVSVFIFRGQMHIYEVFPAQRRYLNVSFFQTAESEVDKSSKSELHDKSDFDLLQCKEPSCEWIGVESIHSEERGLIRVKKIIRRKLDTMINADEEMLQGILESTGMKAIEMKLREQLDELQYVDKPTNAWIPPVNDPGKFFWISNLVMIPLA